MRIAHAVNKELEKKGINEKNNFTFYNNFRI